MPVNTQSSIIHKHIFPFARNIFVQYPSTILSSNEHRDISVLFFFITSVFSFQLSCQIFSLYPFLFKRNTILTINSVHIDQIIAVGLCSLGTKLANSIIHKQWDCFLLFESIDHYPSQTHTDWNTFTPQLFFFFFFFCLLFFSSSFPLTNKKLHKSVTINLTEQ